MSYILDALRKSEQERNPEKVPDLATHHRHIAKGTKTQLSYWLFGIIFLLINGAFLIYIMPENAMKEAPEATISTASHQVSEIKVEPEIAKPKSEITLHTSVVTKDLIAADVSVEVSNPPSQPEKNAPNMAISPLDKAALPDISDLPYSVQQQIPDMDFSTHIYVRDGGSFIIINGKNLSAGMTIIQGLKVLKITAAGVILEFKGRRFFLTSMRSWQQD